MPRNYDASDWQELRQSGNTLLPQGLENGQLYEVRVAAVNAKGAGPYTKPQSAEPQAPPEPPGAPRDLTLTPDDGQIIVKWETPEDLGNPEVSGYLVQHRADGADDWRSVEVQDTGEGLLLGDLENGWLYHVRVSALNDPSLNSENVAASATADERSPGPPVNLTLTPVDEQILVS